MKNEKMTKFAILAVFFNVNLKKNEKKIGFFPGLSVALPKRF